MSAAVGVGLVGAAVTVQAGAQILPPFESTTTTTPPTEPTTAPAPPAAGDPATPPAPPAPTPVPGQAVPDPAPAPAPGAPDGDAGVAAGRNVPAEAQRVINSITRTAANNTGALVEGAVLLANAGVPPAEAVQAVFGRFPVHGESRWSDDWYFPRWTGSQFRYHEGLDMFAPRNTPVVAPVDGIARLATNALGGITVKVFEPDGTYWYLAHLEGTAPGLVDGQPVTAGTVVGFVGNSGNARGTPPHVHLGLYPQGGDAVPPKPIIDALVAEGAARVPELLAGLTPGGVVPAPASAPDAAAAPIGAGAAPVGPAGPVGPSRSALLWASAANPTGGAVHVAAAAAAAAGERIDWTRRAAEQRALEIGWTQSVDRARRLLGPLTNPTLRQVVEAQRDAAG